MREIMEVRHDNMAGAIEALRQVHVPLVQKLGNAFDLVGLGDDKGAYYFIPKIALLFNLPLEKAINDFYWGLTFLAFSAAAFWFFLLFDSWVARVWAVGILFWLEKSTRIWDVYVAGLVTALILIPLFLLLSQKKARPWIWFAALAAAGILCGYANFIRSQSGTCLILFLLLLLAFREVSTLRKAAGIALLLACFLIPLWHASLIGKQRDTFLTQATQGAYQAIPDHSLWHPVYIGLGYVDNPYGIVYKDHVAYEKAESVDPQVKHFSKEYEDILRGQVLLMVETHPLFVLKNIWVKFLTLLGFFVKFANVGLLCFFYLRPSWKVSIPFIVLFLFSAIPGLLVVPQVNYDAVFVATSTVFGIYVTGMAWEKYAGKGKVERSSLGSIEAGLKLEFFGVKVASGGGLIRKSSGVSRFNGLFT